MKIPPEMNQAEKELGSKVLFHDFPDICDWIASDIKLSGDFSRSIYAEDCSIMIERNREVDVVFILEPVDGETLAEPLEEERVIMQLRNLDFAQDMPIILDSYLKYGREYDVYVGISKQPFLALHFTVYAHQGNFLETLSKRLIYAII